MDAMLREKIRQIPAEQLAFRNFPSYVALQNPNYRFAPHNLMISKALMKVEAGITKRLIVTMPPRHGKTMQISEYFPPWYLGRNPSRYVIFATYSFDRSTDVGRKVRNQMIDPNFYKIFKNCSLSTDAKSANRMTTDQGGEYFATGVGGAIVGRGAHLFIIDDPTKSREEADSETHRRKMIDWYQSVAYTRLMPENAIIIVQTRWHYSDLIGFVLEEMTHEKWEKLDLPAICDSHDDPVGREIGEALWPSDYPVEALEQIKQTVGTREWNAQYQQQPLPTEGGLININWFNKYEFSQFAPILMATSMGSKELPRPPYGINKIVMSWDTAFKETELSDPSACTVWGIGEGENYYLIETINKQMRYPTLKKTAIDVWEKYMRWDVGWVTVIIEDKGSGQSLIQDLKANSRIPVIACPADANKQIRMSSVSPLIEAGRVWLPDRSSWVVEYETQLARFPLWKHDDLVDSTSQFLRYMGKPRYVRNSKKRFWK